MVNCCLRLPVPWTDPGLARLISAFGGGFAHLLQRKCGWCVWLVGVLDATCYFWPSTAFYSISIQYPAGLCNNMCGRPQTASNVDDTEIDSGAVDSSMVLDDGEHLSTIR